MSCTPTALIAAPKPPWLTIMITAYCGASTGANEANHEVSSFALPFALRPKSWPVPVLPATWIGKPIFTSLRAMVEKAGDQIAA